MPDLPNLDELEREWAEFMFDRPGKRGTWSQDQRWRADNPGKLALLLEYRADELKRPAGFELGEPGSPERRMLYHLDAWHEATAATQPPPPPPAGDLLKPRPVFANPIVLNLPQSGDRVIRLTKDRDYVVKVGDRRRGIEFVGDGSNSVLVIDGTITPLTPAQSSDISEWRGLILTNIEGLVHIEDVEWEKTSDALAIRSRHAIVHWQRSRINDISGDYSRSHPDGCQTWDGPKEIWVDLLTAIRGDGAKGFLWMTDRPRQTVGDDRPTEPPGFVHIQRAQMEHGAGRSQVFSWEADSKRTTGKGNYANQGMYSAAHRYGLQDGWGLPNNYVNGQNDGIGEFVPYSIFHKGVEYRCDSRAEHNGYPFIAGPVGRTDGDRMIRHDPRFAGQEWTMGSPPGGDYVPIGSVGVG